MRSALHPFASLLLLLAPAAILAQERPKLEVGTSAAMGRVGGWVNGSLAYLSVPGGSWVEGANLYLGFFPSEKVVLEPEASLRWESANEQGATLAGFTGRGKYLFRGAGQGSPYIAGQIGLIVDHDNNPPSEPQDDTDTGYSVGAGLGYRGRPAGSVALSVEARYRRWMGGDYFRDQSLNEFGLVFSVGAVVAR